VRGPSRTAGAYVALLGGTLTAFLELGGRKLTTFTADFDVLAGALAAFGSLVREGRIRRIELDTVDGLPAAGSRLATHFEALGFVRTAKGFLLRPGQPATRPPRRAAR
jgi:ATP-dependent Lhr-like helicase